MTVRKRFWHKIRKNITWVLLAILIANFTTTILVYNSQRSHKVEISDSLDVRSTQLVNATITPMAAVGTGAKVSINGNDAVGQINIETGTNPKAGDLVHVTFNTPYTQADVQPFVSVEAIDQPPVGGIYNTIDWWGFDILTSSVPKPNTNYAFSYIVVCRPWPMYLNAQDQPVDGS